ncbi:MAG: hypothetical protein HUU22_09045 [Phycisphaerae bacterium]|nr:hypothetical protein [Phycisphaerae bacterium]
MARLHVVFLLACLTCACHEVRTPESTSVRDGDIDAELIARLASPQRDEWLGAAHRLGAVTTRNNSSSLSW